MSCAGREDKGLGWTQIGSSGLMPPLRTCILSASCLWGWKALPLSAPVCTELPNSKSTFICMLWIFGAALWGREGKYCHSCCTGVETKPPGRVVVTYLLKVMKLTGKGQREGVWRIEENTGLWMAKLGFVSWLPCQLAVWHWVTLILSLFPHL